MRILFIKRAWPARNNLGRGVAERLSEDGHEITVLCGASEAAPERVRMVRVPPRRSTGRFSGRLADDLRFCIRTMLHIGRHPRSYDAFIVTTSPPVVLALVVRMMAGLLRKPFVYHCQDLHPEITRAAGVLGSHRLFRLLRRLDTSTGRAARILIAVSADVAESWRERGVTRDIAVIPDHVAFDPAERAAAPDSLRKEPGTFRVLFTGAFGLVQALDEVIDAAHHLADHPEIQFVFVGSGAREDRLRERAGPLLDATVAIHPPVDQATVMSLLEAGDVGIASLDAGVIPYAFPSKTLTYLAAGRRVIAVVEADSALGRLISHHDLGQVVPPGKPVELAEAILLEAGSPRTVDRGATEFVLERFGPGTVLPRWSEAMEALG